MKKCTVCKETLPLDAFYRNGKWYFSRCIECLRKIRASPEGRERERSWAKNYRRGEAYRTHISSPEIVERRRVSRRKYYQTEIGQIRRRESAARRKEQIDRATPSWANRVKIARFHDEAKRLTLETGIRHEVDHIIPLLDYKDIVCGLHVENNLRILTAEQHRAEKKYSDWCLENLFDESPKLFYIGL